MTNLDVPINAQVDNRYRFLILLSPIAIICVSQVAARMVGPLLGEWAWAFLFAGYWTILACLILVGGGIRSLSHWLRPSYGGPVWPIIAITFSLGTTVWMTIPNWRLLLQPEILIPTVIFAIVNPCLEEGYWRGLIIRSATGWPGWVAILYSGTLFAINHLFVNVVVPAGRNPFVWVYQLLVGILLGIVYIKTRSLRWPIISHALINLLSLSVPMFMKVYIPGLPG